MCLKGPSSPTSSDSSESSPWQAAGKAYVNYLAAWHSTMRRWMPGTLALSSTLLPTRSLDSQRIHGARAQGGIQQVSSCLALPGADHRWRPLVARGLQHLGSGLRGGGSRRQAAAVILSCRRRRLSDPEEPAGAEGEGPGRPACERRFL